MSANSFVTVAEADTYLEARLNVALWTGTEPKKIAVIEATRELTLLDYQGYRTDDVQALSWPRTGVINYDASIDAEAGSYSGYPEYDDDIIPVRIKEATIELAFAFLKAGTTDLAAMDDSMGIVREKVGPLETEWTPGGRSVGLSRFPRVLALLEPLLAVGSRTSEVQRS